MATNHVQDLKEFEDLFADLAKNCPDVVNAFSQLHVSAVKDGSISMKNKELMALAIGIAVKCKVCIEDHVRTALKAGATRQDIYETVQVAVLMGGGPGLAYGAMAIDVMNQLSAK
ncbi:MAG: carboxymuconolactone decarboxylase family protein [Eubacteriales bacterium]